MSGHERFTDEEIMHLAWLRIASDPMLQEFRDLERERAARVWAGRLEGDRAHATREAAIAKAESGE